MTPDDINSIDARIREVCEQDDRLRAERARKAERRTTGAAPMRENGADEVLYRGALQTTPAAYTPSADPQSASREFNQTLGEIIAEERWRARDETEEALAPLKRQIAALQQEVAELRGFRDGLVGRDVPTAWFKLRGEYVEEHIYSRLDIVSRDGAWWIARHDDPGPIGGDGWKEGPRARQGEKGARGERGLRGSKGAPGRDAPKFTAFDIDRANYRVIAKMSDGAEMTLELRSLFEQFLAEVGE